MDENTMKFIRHNTSATRDLDNFKGSKEEQIRQSIMPHVQFYTDSMPIQKLMSIAKIQDDSYDSEDD